MMTDGKGERSVNNSEALHGIFSSRLFYLALCMLHFALSCSSSAFAEAPAAAIEKIGVEGLYSMDQRELLDLLDLKVGETLDPLRLREGIKRAFLKGIFEDIQVYGEDGNRSVKVLVKERDVIRDIKISGNVSVPDRTIRALFLFKEGRIMRRDLLDEAAGKLREALSGRGFPRAAVTVSFAPASKPNMIDLTVRVDEGKPVLIEKIVVHGAPEEEIRRVIRVKEEDVYDLASIGRESEKITEHYRDLGYLKPVVIHRFADGTLDLVVKTGKRLLVDFEGNTVFSSGTLAREMPFFEAGELRDDLVEEAIRRILSWYHGKGYPFAQAAPVAAAGEKEEDPLKLRFFIYEGERIAVGAIRFTGATLPEQNLKEIMSLKEGGDYNPDLLFSDAEVLREFYNALGYLGVEVEEPEVKIEGTAATIPIKITEGPKTVVDSVEVTGAVSIEVSGIVRAIRIEKGSPYNEVDIADARYRVIDLYLDQGFADVGVSVNIGFGEKGARIIFEIDEGKKTFFGKTIITGNQRTRREAIERELLHRESSPFNPGLLAKERQRLYKLGLFTEVTTEGLEKHEDKRDVLIRVTEGNAGAIEFGVGYGDFEKYRGFADLSYRNLFGMNRQASLRFEFSSLEKRYIINYYEPWFLGRQIPFRAVLLREERTEKNIDTGEISYRLKRNTFTAGVEKRLGRDFKGELYYKFSLVNTFDVKPDVILTKEDTGTLAISAVRPGIIYDTRDNPFEPRKGILAGVTVEVASAALFSETDFAKAIFSGSLYRALSKTFVLAVSFRAGLAQGFGETRELPLVERFFLGGRNTVRGYEQDTLGPKGADGTPTGGNAFVLTNLEVRTSLGKGLGLVTFIDGGNVWLTVDEMDWSLKYTAGLGLRYSTPVGPVRVDYGHKLRKESGLSSGAIHFSIGHAF